MVTPEAMPARTAGGGVSRHVWVGHAMVAAFFAALAVAATWPLAARLSTHLPGAGADDNQVFLWNFWWMRQVLEDGLSGFFHTPFQFHPYGVNLLLHTHAGLSALVGATVLGGLSHQAALNVTIVLSCALNGFSAYLLAYRASARRAAAIVGGMFFALHPSTAKHLLGHFGLYSAWSLAFFAGAMLHALDRGGWWRPAAAGGLLAVVAWVDYYYFVYGCAFVACVLCWRWLRPAVAGRQWVRPSRGDHLLAAVACTCALLAGAIAWTGGFVATIGSIRISLTTGTNLRAVSAAAALWWLWRRWRPVVRTSPDFTTFRSDVRTVVVSLVACAVLVAPLLAAALAMWRDGQYVSQTYFWRTAPAGLDPGTLLLGNPFNAFWGGPVMRLYEAGGIFPFDGPLWPGVAALVLWATRARWIGIQAARLWMTVAAVFLAWSLGPYLLLFGVNTGLPLPGILLRYVPLIANARLPSRAVVFVCLATAVLLALAISRSPRLLGRRYTAAIAALLLLDFWSAPIAMHRLERPAIYDTLAAAPPGAVLEVPVGVRDGFGAAGRIDTDVLFFQSIHGKPLVGGYVSRIPPAVRQAYEREPVLAALVKLSGGDVSGPPAVTGRQVRDVLVASGVRYVVIDREMATPAVVGLVLSMPLERLGEDRGRELYRIR